MKNTLEILIRQDEIVIIHPHREHVSEQVDSEENLRGQLLEFCTRHSIKPGNAVLYISEELLFYKDVFLPLKTRDLRKTVAYQMEMLTPFAEEEVLSGFTSKRGRDNFRVSLVVTPRARAEQCVREVHDAGFKLIGLFPESQRYVGRTRQKNKWALVIPGRFFKVFSFSGSHLDDRFLCGVEPDFDDLAAFCGTETIYHQQPPAESRFMPALQLIQKKQVPRAFNLLPEAYRRKDYFRMAAIILLLLNLAAFLGVLGIKEFSLLRAQRQVEVEISQIMAKVKEVNELRDRESQLDNHIEQLRAIGRNPDIIPLLARLSDLLPRQSYLDQLRMDGENRLLLIQGYTDDISGLTTALQELGNARLKSTSRRQNKTYFQVEISLL